MLSRFELADDLMWLIPLEPDKVSIFQEMTRLFDNPGGYVNSHRTEGTTPIVFSPTEPIDLEFVYDLPDKYPWIIQGVYATNRVTIHVPRSVLSPFSCPIGTPEDEEFIHLDKETIRIRLIEDYGLAYAHFDPTNEANLDPDFPCNFAKIVTRPTELAEYMTSKQDEFVADFRKLDGSGERLVNLPIRFRIGDRLLVQGTVVQEPFSANAVTSMCVKTYGSYVEVLDSTGHYILVYMTEVWRVPYLEV